jgi:hypothetical protein
MRRRTLIDIALRRQRAGTGSLVRESGDRAWLRWPNLARVLAGVPWAVTGAVATRRYMPERATRDLDILVLDRDAEQVARLLTGAGFSYEGRLAIGGSTWRAPDGTPIDVIEGEDPWVAAALVEASQTLDSQGLPCLPLPFLVLMKLTAGRVQDVADIARMLGGADAAQLDQVRAVVRAHASDAVEDLESLISLGKLETGGVEDRG